MGRAEASCTNESDSFAIISIQQDPNGSTIITWESCTNYIYGVFYADQPGHERILVGTNRDVGWGCHDKLDGYDGHQR